MGNNKYALAGWFAITQAILFPIGFFIGILQHIIGGRAFGYTGLTIGPSDFITLVATILGVYVIWMLKKFFNEYCNFHKINGLLIFSIIWAVIFEIIGTALKIMVIALDFNEIEIAIIFGVFMTIFMIAIGIVDILIGVRILNEGESMNSLIRAFAYLSIIAGIFEVSVFLSIFSILILPISLVMIALILLKNKDLVEFV